MTGFTVSVFPFRNRVSPKEAFEGLELGEGKPSRPVLPPPFRAATDEMFTIPTCSTGSSRIFSCLAHPRSLEPSGNPTPSILALTYRTADAIVDRYLKNPAALA